MEELFLSDIEMEKKLLSALLLEGGRAIPYAAEILNPDDFYRPEHKLIYKTLLAISEQGDTEIDALILENELRHTGNLNRVTHEYLFGLLPLEYTTARVPYQAEKVKENATMRRLAETGHLLAEEATQRLKSPTELVGMVEGELAKVAASNQRKEIISSQEVFVAAIKELCTESKGAQGLSTGFTYLNTLIGGLKKSDLIILAARPSMGKTALAMNIASNVAKENTVLIFSLEMSRDQLGQRFLSANARVNSMRIQQRACSEGELSALMDSMAHLSERKMFFDDTMGITLAELKMKARQIKRKHGLDLIVIDYLQLMQGSKTYRGDRVQEVSELSRGLKGLARELDIPVLALSQLSRNVELRADKRPMLSDLRESGSIEQDADIVMFLYRDEYYDRDAERKDIAELIIAKNRNGATGTVPLKFEKEYLLFSDLTRSDFI